MEQYLFEGTVRPERAHLSFERKLKFRHDSSGNSATAHVRVILNQVAVWVDSENPWEIHDLRNVVASILQHQLAAIGFIKGFAYELEIRRVINRSREIDYVFGIGIPCLEERNRDVEVGPAVTELLRTMQGELGIFVQRCLNDLVAAMKTPEDTGFYCYRAIEALRHHCGRRNQIAPNKKTQQWRKFWDEVGGDREELSKIKQFADPARHGDVVSVTSEEREALFMKTWDIVERYLKIV